jgi:hypothetical protein
MHRSYLLFTYMQLPQYEIILVLLLYYLSLVQMCLLFPVNALNTYITWAVHFVLRRNDWPSFSPLYKCNPLKIVLHRKFSSLWPAVTLHLLWITYNVTDMHTEHARLTHLQHLLLAEKSQPLITLVTSISTNTIYDVPAPEATQSLNTCHKLF